MAASRAVFMGSAPSFVGPAPAKPAWTFVRGHGYVVTYRLNYRDTPPCSGTQFFPAKTVYRVLRHTIRELRRSSPSHPDVAWYTGLNIFPYSTRVAVRDFYASKVYAIGITGPVGVLP